MTSWTDDVIVHVRNLGWSLPWSYASIWPLSCVFPFRVTPYLPPLLPPSLWNVWLCGLWGRTCWWWIAIAAFHSLCIVLLVHSLHISCIHLVQPVLPVQLFSLGVPTDVSHLCGDAWLSPPRISSVPDLCETPSTYGMTTWFYSSCPFFSFGYFFLTCFPLPCLRSKLDNRKF